MSVRTAYGLWIGAATLVLVVFLAPFYRPEWFAVPIFAQWPPARAALRVLLLLCIPLAARVALGGRQLQHGEKRGAWFAALACAFVGEVIHYWVVDHGHYFNPRYFADNTAWQLFLHDKILRLSATYTPHTFRILPDGIVAVFQWLTGSFVLSRIIYRLLFDSLLYVVVYRYARVYLSGLFAGGVILLLAVVYPISILKYAGQFVDPASHLSFAICYFCLARQYEPGIAPTLLTGVLCKESIVVMPLCRIFAGVSRRRAVLLTAAYMTAAVSVAFWIRFYVVHGNPEYMIDRVHLNHVQQNLAAYREWAPLYLASFGVLLPGTVLGWRLMDRNFKFTWAIVASAMIVSSVRYSWLAELRNLVPAFILMAVANMRYVESCFAVAGLGPPATGPVAPPMMG